MSLLKKMLSELPFSSDELQTLISTAGRRYKVYQIPKRQLNKFRTIAQPTPEIKMLQRWLINNVLHSLPIHNAATAYRKNQSIGDHASRHREQRYLLKMDFEDFFPSISSNDILIHLQKFGKLSLDDALLVCKLVCWLDKRQGRYCLSIGAPTSPFLSNSILYDFDKKITQQLKGQKIVYSRYADDLAFSTSRPNILLTIPYLVQTLCEEIEYPHLSINHTKTVSTSSAFRQTLVGLVLTPTGEVSLGRERKRRIRSELYRFSKELLPLTEISHLRGELAFAWSVEEKFINSLVRQFGTATFRQLELPFGDEPDCDQ